MALSPNPLCQAARQRLDASMKPLQDSDSSSESEDPDYDDGRPTRPFEGDLFGTAEDYSGDDFGQDPDSDDEQEPLEESPEQDRETAEQRLFEMELEDSWEPDRGPDMPQVHDAVHLDSESDDEDRSVIQDVLLAEQRLLAEERADSHPQIVRYSETYPLSRAGYVVASTGTSSDTVYTSSVNGQQNLWAPFTSEIDWKVARWAKLRGAGSTAFSDLLAIDGVSVILLCSLLVLSSILGLWGTRVIIQEQRRAEQGYRQSSSKTTIIQAPRSRCWGGIF